MPAASRSTNIEYLAARPALQNGYAVLRTEVAQSSSSESTASGAEALIASRNLAQ